MSEDRPKYTIPNGWHDMPAVGGEFGSITFELRRELYGLARLLDQVSFTELGELRSELAAAQDLLNREIKKRSLSPED